MAVEDEGPGIPEDQRELVFQRFWRGDRRRAREEGRSGLGLTIVRQIAESHGGAVRLAGNASGGSTFAIWLPAAPSRRRRPLGAKRPDKHGFLMRRSRTTCPRDGRRVRPRP